MPRRRIGEKLVPDELLNSVQEIAPEWLAARGVRGLTVDLDNTLAPYGQKEPSLEVKAWVRQMLDAGVPLVVLTNNAEDRGRAFCQPLGVPFVFRARKPRGKGFRRAIALLGLSSSACVAHVGDQVYTDVWGAKRIGLTAILVQPVLLRGHPMITLRHWLERPFIRQAAKREEATTCCNP